MIAMELQQALQQICGSARTSAPSRRHSPKPQCTPFDGKRATLDHVRQACALFDSGSAAPKRHLQSMLLLLDGRRYPAKFIQALAQSLAAGSALDAERSRCRDSNTIKFFDALGLTTQHGPSQLVSPAGPKRNSA